MSGSRSRLDERGPAAPPRRNGELLFAAPWESRVFGMALALHDRGLFEWEEFRPRLIREIAREERTARPPEAFPYYDCWLRALLDLLDAKGLAPAAEVQARVRELALRPSGHDHDHDHDHDHLRSARRGVTRGGG
jgi:nitrile hydratase accessory protein